MISNVQILRFIAAASVLASHSALLIPASSPFWRVPWTAGVDLFFVISGFVMAWLTRERFGSRGAARTFAIRRAIRIIPPYYLFTAVMVAVILVEGSRADSLDPRRLATSFGFLPWPRQDGEMVPILPPGWTLNYEAFFYLCFTASLLFRSGRAWLCGGLIALALLHPLIPESWFVLRFYSAPIILEFVCGILLAELYARGVRLKRWGSALCLLLAVGVWLAVLQLPMLWGNRFALFGVGCALIAAGFVLAPEPVRIGWLRRTLQAGGDASYTLYLSHIFTVNAVILLWRRTGIDAPWLSVLVAMAASIAAAWLFYRHAERPLTDWLQRRFGGSPASAAQDVAP